MTGLSRTTGRMLTRREHIHQSITDILTTPIGSRVMRRNYGSFLPQLVDHPATGANRLRLIAATAQAIMKWEPRTRVSRIAIRFNATGQCEISIARRDINSGEAVTSSVVVGASA